MVAVAILAAGRGTRMKSALPGPHSLGASRTGSPSCLDICRRGVWLLLDIRLSKKAAMQSIPELEFVEQTEQLGTGHAVQQLPHLVASRGICWY